MNNTTHALAEFAARLDCDALPAHVTERVKLLFLDTIGSIIRARHDAESTPSMVRAAERLGLGGGNCSVFGDPTKYAAPAAAFLNGALAHSLDFDDTHAAGSIHSSAPIFPAAFAAAETAGASGRELIAAVVAGYEIQIRLAMALDPGAHYARGFHPTATCGVFGAAIAAGKLFGLTEEQMVSALGIALSQAAGSMQFLEDGAWTKRSQVGQAAQNGLIAAVLAAEGFRGPARAIEGRAGFLHAYAPDADASKAVAALGEKWETMRLAVKPYPCCRYAHAALEALIALREEHHLTPDEIKAVEIGLSRVGLSIIGEPEAAKWAPKTIVDAQFSMPFCAAVVLCDGKLEWESYRQHLNNTQTLALCRRVHCMPDEDAERCWPANMSGKARLQTARGVFVKFVEIPRGEPDNFPNFEDFRAKFYSLAGPYLRERALRVADLVLSLATASDVRALAQIACLR